MGNPLDYRLFVVLPYSINLLKKVRNRFAFVFFRQSFLLHKESLWGMDGDRIQYPWVLVLREGFLFPLNWGMKISVS